MTPLTFDDIDRIADLSRQPLDNSTLERFQGEYYGRWRHWYYRFFFHLAREMRPEISLEIGVHHGHGFIHMAYGNLQGVAVGIDKAAERYTRHNYNRYAPENCYLIPYDSLSAEAIESVEILVGQFGQIGLVYQDSSHHYLESKEEFRIYSQFLAPGAIWCCDDVMEIFHDPKVDPPGKSMLTYFEELPGRKKLYDKLHHGSVIGVAII